MRRTLPYAAALLLAAAPAQAGAPSGYALADPLDGYRATDAQDWPVPFAASEAALIAAVRAAFTTGESAPPVIGLERVGGRLALTVETFGLLDDSVSAIRRKALYRPLTDGGWAVTRAGAQFRCARGAMAGEFTDQLCP